MSIRRVWVWLVCLVLLSAGCWSRREVNEVAISSAIALDREPGQQIRVTMQFLRPTMNIESSQPRTATFNVTATGRTTAAAVRNLNQLLSRRPEWKHNNAIVLSEDVARHGVGEIMDFFVRNHESRLDQWILVTRGRAADILVPRFELESNQGIGIRRLNRNSANFLAATVPVRLYDFVMRLSEPSEAPVAAAIETVTFPDPSRESDANRRLRIRGAAVFRRDRLVGWLNEVESRSLDWLRGEASGAVVTVPCRAGGGQGTSLELISVRSTLRPYWKNGQPAVRAVVQASGMLGDLMCQDDLTKPGALADLQRRAALQIQGELVRLVRRLQKDLRADAIGVGAAVRRTFPRAWRQMEQRWEQLYPTVSVTPEVTVELTQIGTSDGKPMSGGSGGQ